MDIRVETTPGKSLVSMRTRPNWIFAGTRCPHCAELEERERSAVQTRTSLSKQDRATHRGVYGERNGSENRAKYHERRRGCYSVQCPLGTNCERSERGMRLVGTP